MADQFVVKQLQAVMNLDSVVSANPLTNEDTYSPSDLSRMFNSITYSKGASFVRMIQNIMGEENFVKSLREYLDK